MKKMKNIWDSIPGSRIIIQPPPLKFKAPTRTRGASKQTGKRPTPPQKDFYVVYLDGKYRRAKMPVEYRWDTFFHATGYTLSRAQKIVDEFGGEVLPKKRNETETLEFLK